MHFTCGSETIKPTLKKLLKYFNTIFHLIVLHTFLVWAQVFSIMLSQCV